jgi:membrane protein implicated in regulation of membrane protease activity
MVVLAIIAIFVLSAVFGWHGTARGVAWLICFAVALAVAIPVTVRSAMAERKAISRQEQPRDGDG